MFWKLFLVELRKILKRRFFWVEVGLLALLTVIVHAGLIVILHMPAPAASDAAQLRGAIPDTLQPLLSLMTGLFAGGGNLMGLLLIALVAAIVAQEYTWGTVHLWLSRGVPRILYLLTKVCALSVALLILVVTPVLVSVPFVFYTVPEAGGAVSMTLGDLWQVAAFTIRVAYVLLPYAALTLLLSVNTRSPLAAGGLAIGFSVVAEPLLSVAGAVNERVNAVLVYLPGNLGQAVMSEEAAANGQLLSPGAAAAILAVWVLLFLGLAFWIFRRQDVA